MNFCFTHGQFNVVIYRVKFANNIYKNTVKLLTEKHYNFDNIIQVLINDNNYTL